MKKTLIMTLVATFVGASALAIYKMYYNPDCINDIKDSIDLMGKKMNKAATNNIENMM